MKTNYLQNSSTEELSKDLKLKLSLKDYLLAKQIADELLRRDDTDINVLYALGWITLELNDYERALEIYNQIISLDESDHKAWSLRGVVLEDLERIDEALEAYSRALQYEPEDTQSYIGKGRLLMKQKKWEEAIEVFTTALDYDNLTEIWINISQCYEKLEQLTAALQSITQAKNCDPSEMKVLMTKAWLHYKLNEFDDALEELEELIEISTSITPEIWETKAFFLIHVGREEEAKQCLSKANALRSNNQPRNN